jgi:hypothetical protein
VETGESDSDDAKQRAFDEEKDDAFNDKFRNPDTFFEHLFNEAGPNVEAMEDLVKLMAERIDIDKGASIEPDLMQCDISEGLHHFLELKGDNWQERKEFLQDLLGEFKQQKEEHNPGETQDTTAVRTTLHSQEDAMDVQEDAEGTGRGDG